MTVAVSNPSLSHANRQAPLRVMVVDDAVVVRGLISRWVELESGLELVASLRDGREAIEQLEKANPDVVILDVDMPDTDGITALPHLLAKKRDLVVIMASTLTRHNAEISLRALALGAADYITKPGTTREVTVSMSFRSELMDKIRVLGGRRRRLIGARSTPSVGRKDPQQPDRPGVAAKVHPVNFRRRATDVAEVLLRPFSLTQPRVLLLGASTGGPQALDALVGCIGGVIDAVPVLIVQHMPPTFTTIFGEHLSRSSGRIAREPEHGEPVRAGRIYVAPGGRHMRVERRKGHATIALDDGPQVNFCKPSVDPLFSSAAEVWKDKCLAVVLTGMGSDGARGAADVVAAGGAVIAQDEATSVVWGMPGSVANAGLCSSVLPLDQIAPQITRLFSGRRQ